MSIADTYVQWNRVQGPVTGTMRQLTNVFCKGTLMPAEVDSDFESRAGLVRTTINGNGDHGFLKATDPGAREAQGTAHGGPSRSRRN